MTTEVTIYDALPNGQYGVAVEIIDYKQKSKRIAHTYLMGKGVNDVDVTVSLPTNMSLAELRDCAGKLLEFADKVESLKNTAPSTFIAS